MLSASSVPLAFGSLTASHRPFARAARDEANRVRAPRAGLELRKLEDAASVLHCPQFLSKTSRRNWSMFKSASRVATIRSTAHASSADSDSSSACAAMRRR